VSRDERRTQPKKAPSRKDDGPVLPDISRDETSEGWGEESERRDAAWYERERPPHHE
jgi:hypothetical protein